MNRDKKELYLSMKYSPDKKKLICDEKGPEKKKSAKTFADKSKQKSLFNNINQFIHLIIQLKDKHWEDLKAKLPDDQVRYIAIQVDYKDAKGTLQNDTLFIAW
jgi:hypothetical protein